MLGKAIVILRRKYHVVSVLWDAAATNPCLRVSLPSLPSRLETGSISWYCEACLFRAIRRTDIRLAILIDNESDGHTDLGVLKCETQEAFTCSNPSRREHYRQRQMPIVRLHAVRLTRSPPRPASLQASGTNTSSTFRQLNPRLSLWVVSQHIWPSSREDRV